MILEDSNSAIDRIYATACIFWFTWLKKKSLLFLHGSKKELENNAHL